MNGIATSFVPIDPLSLLDERRRQGRQKQQIFAVIDPSGRREYAHLEFAASLAVEYKWSVKSLDDISTRRPCAVRTTRTIHIGPIVTDADFAIFVHEGGHLEDPHGDDERTPGEATITQEIYAWRFAITTLGRRWNPSMQLEMRECLLTYLPRNVTKAFEPRDWWLPPAYNWDEMRPLEALVAEGVERARAFGVVRIR